MKLKQLSLLGAMAMFLCLKTNETNAQNVWTNTTSTTTSTGNVGIRTTNPRANLHLHGNQNYTETVSGPVGPIGGSGTQTINHGRTARLLFTNSTVSDLSHRGFEMRLSQTNMVMRNQEDNGTFTLSAQNAPHIQFHSPSGRLFMGTPSINTTWQKLAAINIERPNQNALYVRASNANNYGIFIHSRPDQEALIIESGIGFTTTRNFKVTGDGFVFARRYTTTLNNIPDYVFEPTYNLMPLSDLRNYLNTNKHLPNIPSAVEMESAPVDLGELTRLLLEKVEESTLYILQLEERIRTLESGN